MSERIRYTDEPIGDPKVIRGFLPSPDELAFCEEAVKITITVSKLWQRRRPGKWTIPMLAAPNVPDA